MDSREEMNLVEDELTGTPVRRIEVVMAGTLEYDALIAEQDMWRRTPHECDVLTEGDFSYPCSLCGCV